MSHRNTLCTRCGRCLDACPEQTVVRGTIKRTNDSPVSSLPVRSLWMSILSISTVPNSWRQSKATAAATPSNPTTIDNAPHA
ncbi:MAG: 4Fe-4S binding protein [Dehalococcoidia bacterium]|nr:4Fe-4S binding protein [Dehalococcoidia bacterium]